jgi:hypothetical protein
MTHILLILHTWRKPAPKGLCPVKKNATWALSPVSIAGNTEQSEYKIHDVKEHDVLLDEYKDSIRVYRRMH